MTKQMRSALNAVLFISIVFFGSNGFTQEIVDDPNLDQVPLWYLEQIQNMPRQNSEVITINDFDNFYLGVDFAEGHISGNPLSPTEFFTAFNTDGSHYTMDGHLWSSSNPVWGASMRGDPVTAYDGIGNLFYENMYGSTIQGCKVVVSNDNGQTWSPAVNAITGNDKNWIACDQTNGPYANYVYTTMTNNGSGNFTRSTDHGQTWQNTFNPNTQSLPGMMVCVGPYQSTQGGSVFVVTNGGSSFASTYTFYRSLDGGSTFSQMSSQNFSGYVGRDVNGRNSVENMRTRPYPFIAADNSYGPNRGRLHLVYASNDPPGNGNKPDIWSRYSDDGGLTWSDAKRVNSGFAPTASHQWQPAIWCDKDSGRLYVQWMDTRDTPTNDSALIYATYSDDGGVSFKYSQRISNEKMKINCSTCGGGGTPRYEGDYNGTVSNSDVSYLTWSDFRWGNFASFTGYFPDFAMRIYPENQEISLADTLWAVVPGTKLYENKAIFTASIQNPVSGSFTVAYPSGNEITTFPDSIPIVIIVNQVPLGDYAVTIKGEGPNGTPVHFREATIQVVPIPPPVADFSVNDTTTCQGYVLNFMDESTNATSWLWTFEGGIPATSTEQNPTDIMYATSGVFDVSLQVTNPSGTDLITKVDYIDVSILPEPPSGDGVFVCKNVEIPPLEVIGENISWYSNPELTDVVFSGNSFQTGDSLPGNYPYYATQTVGECESQAIELTLTIYDTPNVSFMPMDSICLNAAVFEMTNGQPEGGSYFGPGVFDGTFDASIAGEGIHTLGYSYADPNLCADTAYQTITILPLPEVTMNPVASVCVNGAPFELSGGSPAGGEYSGPGVVGNMFYPDMAGQGQSEIAYTIVGENGCTNSALQAITIFEMPQVALGNDTTLCGQLNITLDATIPNATSYLWNPGSYTTPSITIDSSGIGYHGQEFSVMVTDENTCSASDTIKVTFIDCTGIDEIVGLENVSIYPNPNDGTFNLSIRSSRILTIDLKIFDALGTSYFEQKQQIIDGAYSSRISLSEMNAGIYFITLRNEKGIFVKKFLVK